MIGEVSLTISPCRGWNNNQPSTNTGIKLNKIVGDRCHQWTLGQIHNPASGEPYSHMKIVLLCAILKSGDRQTLCVIIIHVQRGIPHWPIFMSPTPQKISEKLIFYLITAAKLFSSFLPPLLAKKNVHNSDHYRLWLWVGLVDQLSVTKW